jgi:sec-independent protein translocase protein TatA
VFNIGTPEILVILAVALILFGPKKLPEIGKSLGQGLRELKKASRDVMDSIHSEDDDTAST